ncbi:cell division protein FtsI/penicillin-binding protein 2 [Allocatelliglobosispora scoriae]|uniref:Cell division protein FtsI/penicillin-binding protein 2 n=1 Tax=Allocatelliglobosispora scoriae TaxID=643052 RepID=A0A841BQI2_9ACTN|nr:penicillin-binding transpeptidase domain-containing protein [Allocatelliglobosispora scoriae]MBB5869955.1 cell division protein FtsI/penicillin-binding protein 2 [Allocatelliglobosispora scoriae]
MLKRAAALACTLILSTATLVGCSDDPSPDDPLALFAAGWSAGQFDSKLAFASPTGQAVNPSTVADELKAYGGTLGKPVVKVTGKATGSETAVTGPITVDWALPGGQHWTYPSQVRLTKAGENWQVVWEPKIVHEKLNPGDSFATRSLTALRGDVIDAKGQPIVSKQPVVTVGIEPRKVKDLPTLLLVLDGEFKKVGITLDFADVPARVKAAKPDGFVELVTLRRPAYMTIRDIIQPLEGTAFIEGELPLAPSRVYARALLGSVGDVTKEMMDAAPGKYEIGDQVGMGGLQKKYDDRLRGTEGARVVISHKGADGGVVDITAHEVAAVNGSPLKLTLDAKTQNAADKALAGKKDRRTSIVAIRISDGQVLAAANGPDGGGENLAFTAQVPPGSTFKVVSAFGLVDNGSVTPDTIVACPKEFSVSGRVFHNAHDFELGDVAFRLDMAKSCNTAFASLAPKLGPDGLASAGMALGLGTPWDLGADAFSGAVSTGGSDVERAAASFGQGTTVVSPIAMAGAVAGIARGQWKQPTLVLDPAPAKPAPDGAALKPATVDALKLMLREVVTMGTGKTLSDVPGGPVYGKTGTAEFDGDPSHTHAWFVGWQGDVAFAVFVENGGDSTSSAVPLTEAFLRALR